jgi:putative ABC transport system permease protein
MDWLNAVNIAFKALLVHKVRAFLSMLGIIFGTASVVAVITVSEGARTEVLKQLAALGADNIIVVGIENWQENAGDRERKKRTRLHSEGLTLREAEEAARHAPGVDNFTAIRRLPVGVRRGAQTWGVEPVGATASFLEVMGFDLRMGRWFTPADEESARRVCVLEDDVARRYFGDDSPLDASVIVNHEPYTIIGVLKSKEKSSDKYDVAQVDRLNRRLYVPLAAASARMPRNPLADEVDRVIFHCGSTDDIQPAARFLERFYLSAHRCEGREEEDRDYRVLIARDLLRQIVSAQNIFNIVMLCSAGISLLVGGIGIMNIMLANVGERRWEIGLRRAVGATQRDILSQFLFESLAICLLGGLAGCVLGAFFQLAVGQLTGWETSWNWWAVVAAGGVSLFDGVLFGTYPAWQAARMDPIDALRYE